MTSDDRSALQFRRMTETPIPQLVLSLAAPTILSMPVSYTHLTLPTKA